MKKANWLFLGSLLGVLISPLVSVFFYLQSQENRIHAKIQSEEERISHAIQLKKKADLALKKTAGLEKVYTNLRRFYEENDLALLFYLNQMIRQNRLELINSKLLDPGGKTRSPIFQLELSGNLDDFISFLKTLSHSNKNFSIDYIKIESKEGLHFDVKIARNTPVDLASEKP